MKIASYAGAASQVWQIVIQDATSLIADGLGGVLFNAAGLTCAFKRNKDNAWVEVTLADMTLGAYTSGGLKESDPTVTLGKGAYDFCPPNAALTYGADSVLFRLAGADSMVPLYIEAQLNLPVVTRDEIDCGLALAHSTTGLTLRTGVTFPDGQLANNAVIQIISADSGVGQSRVVNGNVGGAITFDPLTVALGSGPVYYSLSASAAAPLSSVPPTAVQVRNEMDSNSTKLAGIDAATIEALGSLQNAVISLDLGLLSGTISVYRPGSSQTGGNLLRTIPISRPSINEPFSLNRVS